MELDHGSEVIPEESAVEVGGEGETEVHVCVDEEVLVEATFEEKMFWEAPECYFAKKVDSFGVGVSFDYEIR